jgi:S-adenosylmethionine hydrolase
VFISFLSDYGDEDEFVGVCHGVIARRCPEARVIDLTHGVPRGDVLAGALTLAAAVEFMPKGVHLAVVDPGVGTPRRALALAGSREGHLLVGPDNGLLLPAAELLGGVAQAIDVTDSPERLWPTSSTFHGRDLFAPVAAALAAGTPLEALGAPIGAETLIGVELPHARTVEQGLLAHVVHHDAFGNLVIDATLEQLSALGVSGGEELIVRSGGEEHRARLLTAFGEAPMGGLLIYEDSRRMLALAVNQGSAAELLGMGRTGEELLLMLP